jgi:single-stranded DNA-binding protein
MLKKGDKAIVTGRLQIANYTDKEGNARTSLEINADAVGIVPKFAPEPQEPRSDKSDEEPIEDFPW